MMRRVSAMLCVGALCAAAHGQDVYTVRTGDAMLVHIDPETLVMTDVGPLGVPFDFGGLAWDGETMWMVQGFDGTGLYTLDLETGAATFVGSHGFGEMFGLEYDPTTNTLYGSLSTTATGFYELDRSDGSATFIGDPGINLDALSYDGTRDILVGAEAGPGDLHAIDRATGQPTELIDDDFFNNCGMTYLPGQDRHWLIDWSGNLYEIDPNAGYARTVLLSGLGAHDGLVFVGAGAPPCAADCNADGQLNVLDFVCFQGEFDDQTPFGDCDDNGQYNILDFVCYQGLFQDGCP